MPILKKTPTKKAVTKKAAVKKVNTPKSLIAKKVTAKKKPIAKKPAPGKKAVAKNRLTHSSRTIAKPLVIADDARSFWVADGKILNSLVALRFAFAEMESAVYAHHVNQHKNDFAQWVNDVLCDETCAKALMKAKTPAAAQTIIIRHLKSYTV